MNKKKGILNITSVFIDNLLTWKKQSLIEKDLYKLDTNYGKNNDLFKKENNINYVTKELDDLNLYNNNFKF